MAVITGRNGRQPSRGLVVTVLIGALAVLLVGIVGLALAGRRPPGDPVDLTFPLGSGTYLVVNGGSQALTNAHLGTLEGERFAPYRGQSYGVDLVRINRVGLRVPGLLPADPTGVLHLWRSGPGAVSRASPVRGGWRG